MSGDEAVVAGDYLDADAACCKGRKRFDDAGLRRIAEQQEAGEGQVLFAVAIVAFGRRREAADGEAEHAIAFIAPGGETALDRRPALRIERPNRVAVLHLAAGFEDVAERALGDQ